MRQGLLDLADADWALRAGAPTALRNSPPAAERDLAALANELTNAASVSSVDAAADACVVGRAVAACTNGVIGGGLAVLAAVLGTSADSRVSARTFYDVVSLSIFNTFATALQIDDTHWGYADVRAAQALCRQHASNIPAPRNAPWVEMAEEARRRLAGFAPFADDWEDDPGMIYVNAALLKDSLALAMTGGR